MNEPKQKKKKELKIPKEPSLAERLKHNENHLPYRNWCEACVRGKGKERGHLASDVKENGHELLSCRVAPGHVVVQCATHVAGLQIMEATGTTARTRGCTRDAK